MKKQENVVLDGRGELCATLASETAMTIADTIRAKLAAALTPAECSIEDESARHAGHAGSPGGAGETHFRIRIVSAAFAGETRIARHRRIYDILAHELNSGVHALALTTLTPEEAGR